MKLLFALFCIGFTSCVTVNPKKLRGNLFSELAPGDRVTVRYGTMNSWQSLGYDLRFDRSATTTVEVTRLTRQWNNTKKVFEYHSPKRIGTVTLSSTDIRGLDLLVRFYRTHPEAGCTRQDEITIEHFRGIHSLSTPIAREFYYDVSCAAETIHGVTTLPTLIARAEQSPNAP